MRYPDNEAAAYPSCLQSTIMAAVLLELELQPQGYMDPHFPSKWTSTRPMFGKWDPLSRNFNSKERHGKKKKKTLMLVS